MAKPRYTKPADQLDLEARQKSDYTPPAQLNKGVDPELADSGFVGVDPIYQNFANDTEKPFAADGGPLEKLEKNVYADDADFDKGAAEEGGAVEEDENEGSSTPLTTSPSTTTPPITTAPSNS